jgi:ubiquinone/menaquinone biosynthesis C-methylase UbiE
MPWGRQVQVDEGLKNFYRQSLAEMQRVVRPSGIIVILTTYPELLAESPASATEISLFGQNPHILTYPVR